MLTGERNISTHEKQLCETVRHTSLEFLEHVAPLGEEPKPKGIEKQPLVCE